MIDYNAPLYQFPQETWDAAKCEKMAKAKSQLAPFKGYLGSSASIPPAFGVIRYNGGCIRPRDNGEWYQGENRPFPIVAEGYEIIHVTSWGWRIVNTTTRDKYYQGRKESP